MMEILTNLGELMMQKDEDWGVEIQNQTLNLLQANDDW